MTERGRNRLVGAVMLTSLAVILLPMLFDGAGIERREMAQWPEEGIGPETAGDDGFDREPDEDVWAFTQEVEARRGSETVRGQAEHRPIAEPLPTGVAPDPDAESAEDGAEDVDETLAEAGLDARNLPRAFSVQLAAFRDKDNARALRQRLLDDGYDAYLLEEPGSEDTLHRVAVGPRIDQAAAVRLQAELAERYELEGLVVRFAIGRATERRDG